MSLRPVGLVFAALTLAYSGVARSECQTNGAGQSYATGKAAAAAAAETVTVRRLGAERAAFLDAVKNLKACLGDKGKPITGWTLLEVRYFDSDPIVETDVAPRYEKTPLVTVPGSAAPMTSKGTIDEVRVDTTKAAVVLAERNAKEALDAVFPASGAAGVRQKLAGSLDACVPAEVSYWDDGAVSVKVTCGKGVDTKQAPETKKQPPVLKHTP